MLVSLTKEFVSSLDIGSQGKLMFRLGYRAAVILFLLAVYGGSAEAGTEDEVKTVFRAFIAAQNSHDLRNVAAILSDTPEVAWITRRSAVLGREAILQGFERNYQGTWLIEPEYDNIRVTDFSGEVAQLVVPAAITIGTPGETKAPQRFVLVQTYTKSADGWRLATIVTVPSG